MCVCVGYKCTVSVGPWTHIKHQFHTALTAVHTALTAVHTALTAVHTALTAVHTAMTAVHTALTAVHTALTAVHTSAANCQLCYLCARQFPQYCSHRYFGYKGHTVSFSGGITSWGPQMCGVLCVVCSSHCVFEWMDQYIVSNLFVM
jgi:hypothetical protein